MMAFQCSKVSHSIATDIEQSPFFPFEERHIAKYHAVETTEIPQIAPLNEIFLTQSYHVRRAI
jgi:hypothetical protein